METPPHTPCDEPELAMLEDRKLGSGASGSVYLCRYNAREAVVKLFPNVWDVKSYLQEAKILKKLKHNNIIQFHDVRYHQGKVGIIIDYVKRGSLRDVLEQGKLDNKPRTKERIINDIVNGLAYLHRRNIIHRDLKSMNILLTRSYQAKICDFGLATKRRGSDKGNTRIGTLRWMAPELLTGEPNYTHASDVYALGWILWEMLTNKVPYHDIHDLSLVEERIQNGEQGEIPNDAPEKYVAMIRACWPLDPKERATVRKLHSTLSFEFRVNDEEFKRELADSDESDNESSDEENDGDVSGCNDDTTSVDDPSIWSSVLGTINQRQQGNQSFEQPEDGGAARELYQQGSIESLLGNFSRAFECYSAAAAQSIPEAHYALGQFYHFARGIPRDYKKAAKHYAEAAKLGYAPAQCSLGNLYRGGLGVPKDHKKEFELYTQAVEQGYARAKRDLANMYEEGRYVPKDYEKAVELYAQAVEEGEVLAQCNLGYMYKRV